MINKMGISHVFGGIYGCFNLAGECVFQGEFVECQKYSRGEDAMPFRGWFRI